MSLKENIEAIKEELSAEEKFLESVIKTESFYKKNKKLIIGFAIAVLVGVFGSMGYNYLKEQKSLQANELYMTLLNNPDATKAKELQSLNPKLYQLYLIQTAMKTSDIKKLEELKDMVSDPILKDIVTYQVDSMKKSSLLKYASAQGAVFKDFANIQAAYLELEKGDHKKAEDILSFIAPTSTFYQIAQSLKHYLK